MTRAHSRGYTLIELLVSLAIFSILMLAATAAYLSYIAYNRQAQTTASVMNALAFAVDTMTRDIRTGTGYVCVGSCSSGGTTNISFTDESGCTVTYTLGSQNGQSGTVGDIQRSVADQGNCTEPQETNVPLTEGSLNVTNLEFYVRGVGKGDNTQPIVVITVGGSGTVPNSMTTIPFNIQMTAVQRQIDL